MVAEAADGRRAVDLALETRPQVVIADVALPELNGIEVTRRILAGLPEARMIAPSMYSDRYLVAHMLGAGAVGYVLKACAFEEVVRAVGTVSNGRVYLCPEVSEILVDGHVRGAASPRSVLSGREREVAQLLAEGKRARVIAGTTATAGFTARPAAHV